MLSLVVADLLLYKYPVTGQGVDSKQSSDQPVLQGGRHHVTVVDEYADGGLRARRCGSRRRRCGGVGLHSFRHLDRQQHARGRRTRHRRHALLGPQLRQTGTLQQARRQPVVVSEKRLLAVRCVLFVLVHFGE